MANEPRIQAARDPDPETADGFLALWDALIARGWRVDVNSMLDGFVVNMHRYSRT